MVAVFKQVVDEVDQRIILSQYSFPENQRAIVVYISLFQSNTLQHAYYVFLHPFFSIPFSRSVSTHDMKKICLNFQISTSILDTEINTLSGSRKPYFDFFFFFRTETVNQISKKKKITLGISLNFSSISNMELLHDEFWYFITST